MRKYRAYYADLPGRACSILEAKADTKLELRAGEQVLALLEFLWRQRVGWLRSRSSE